MELINIENFCETFGWTVEQYENTDLFMIESFKAIISGKNIGMKDKMAKGK